MSILKEGDDGPEVRNLQELLNARGYPVSVDGSFGPLTVAAVRAFQTQNLDSHAQPLTIDGTVGPRRHG